MHDLSVLLDTPPLLFNVIPQMSQEPMELDGPDLTPDWDIGGVSVYRQIQDTSGDHVTDT
jgi:hypothetical protein